MDGYADRKKLLNTQRQEALGIVRWLDDEGVKRHSGMKKPWQRSSVNSLVFFLLMKMVGRHLLPTHSV